MIKIETIEIDLSDEDKKNAIEFAQQQNMQLEHFIIKTIMEEIKIKYTEVKLKIFYKEEIESFYKEDIQKEYICEYIRYLNQFIPYNSYIEKENMLKLRKLREHLDDLTNDFENDILEKIDFLNKMIYSIQFIPPNAIFLKK